MATSFLWYHKDFANLLFWVIWACLITSTKINRISLKESLMFICMQNTTPSLPSFLRHCTDITVGNKEKGRISKWVLQENKARQIFRKAKFLTPRYALPTLQTYHCFLIPSSTENNFIYLSIRQGIKYKIICSGVISVYSSITFCITTWQRKTAELDQTALSVT